VNPSPVTIYVYLLGEGTDVWRPVEAVHLGHDRYQITSVHADSSDEHWQFSTGDIVRCSIRILSGGPALVAHERVQQPA
jgi:hypothetical protein